MKRMTSRVNAQMANSTYQARDPRAQLNTLRSLPLFRPAAAVFGAPAAAPIFAAAPVVRLVERPATALELAQAGLQLAEGARHNAQLEYVAARRSIGMSNRGSLPATRYSRVVQFTPAQVRAHRVVAFRAFNRSAARLRAADR